MNKFLILILFFLISCATEQRTRPIDSDLHVVDIDSNPTGKQQPLIESGGSGPSVGPQAPGGSLYSGPLGKKKVWGLVLSPGLNRVICHAVALRALKEKGISFNVVTGSGMGAIVASYLATGTTPEIIEWKFHKFFQKSNELRPFSEKWIKEVESNLLKDFKGKKIQSTKLTLLIPLYNNEERKIEYVKRGDLYDTLLSNLSLSKSRKGIFSTSIEKGRISTAEMRKMGVEKVVSIDAIKGKIGFERKEDYLFGVYGRLSKGMPSTEIDFELDLPVDNLSLDDSKGLPEFLRVSYLYLRDNSGELKQEYLEGNKVD